MQTRAKAKLAKKSESGFNNLLQNIHGTEEHGCSQHAQAESSTLVDASRNDIDKLLERVEGRQRRMQKRQNATSSITDTYHQGRKRKKLTAFAEDALFYQRESSGKLSESNFQGLPCCGTEAKKELDSDIQPNEKDGSNGSYLKEEESEPRHSMEDKIDVNEDDDYDWEDCCYGDIAESSSREPLGNITIEIDDDSQHRQFQKHSTRRPTSKDKEFAELVHKVHLLCLLARGIMVTAACDDPFVKASMLSLIPSDFMNLGKEQRLTANMLCPLVKWFQSIFIARAPSEESSENTNKDSFVTKLVHAIETRSGSEEEIAALSVTLFKVLGLTARYVFILDVSSLKPDAESMDASAGWESETDEEDRLSLYHMNKTKTTTASLGQILARCQPQSSHHLRDTDDTVNRTFTNKKSESKNIENGGTLLPRKSAESNKLEIQDVDRGKDLELPGSENFEGLNELNGLKPVKRKGDREFEMQLAMALSATAVQTQDNSSNNAISNDAKKLNDSGTESVVRVKTGGRGSRLQKNSAYVWSRKNLVGQHWAEVYCEGESLTGRWVHVDASKGIVDGADKIETTASCKRPVRYVIGFSGNGAKDISRRYVSKWSSIAKQRVSSDWWNVTMKPLTELEAAATAEGCEKPSGPYDRNSLEDMELETRTLTEPLPTNQQAYRNHHLYVLERWLSKYETLYPKGPVLGYCSGQPVYPRSCVQAVHTASTWLREGLQVKKGENPVKVVKHHRPAKQFQLNSSELGGNCFGGHSIELFGRWQTEPLQLPAATGGIVPKNERGNIEVWSEKCLPPGTVHLRIQRLGLTAKKLNIDFAQAVVGFEVRNGRSVPVFDGIVVCEEFSSTLLQAYAEEEQRRLAEMQKKMENAALSRWNQLLRSIATRQRLQNTYNSQQPEQDMVGSTSQTTFDSGDNNGNQGSDRGMPSASNQDNPEPVTQNHMHTFPAENQKFDEETSIWTKWCSCGFSIQVEEM